VKAKVAEFLASGYRFNSTTSALLLTPAKRFAILSYMATLTQRELANTSVAKEASANAVVPLVPNFVPFPTPNILQRPIEMKLENSIPFATFPVMMPPVAFAASQ